MEAQSNIWLERALRRNAPSNHLLTNQKLTSAQTTSATPYKDPAPPANWLVFTAPALSSKRLDISLSVFKPYLRGVLSDADAYPWGTAVANSSLVGIQK